MINHLKQFIDEYKNCPLCNSNLEIHSLNQSDDVYIKNNKLTITINSNYFVDCGKENFEFSISIINGSILRTSAAADKFTSLYDLEIFLRKSCESCQGQNKSFYRTINIFYDRQRSAFSSIPYIESFSVIYNNVHYILSNNYYAKSSFICVDNKLSAIPHIPFSKFDFSNEEKIVNKLNNILLLK